MNNDCISFQTLIATLKAYWAEQGCVIVEPMDCEMGAGTFHPATFLKAIGPEPWRCAYVQPCRRPTDGRYGENPNRTQHYFQFQVVLKPSPLEMQQIYLGSLAALNIDCQTQDIRFVEDNWTSPTLGAWGLGYEVWLNGMEVSQFTYFQQIGGLNSEPVTGEITYGLERLAMALQNVDSMFDLVWAESAAGTIRYGDLFLENEKQMSVYNFEKANTDILFDDFEHYEQAAKQLLDEALVLPAYEQALKASHAFNLLDARQAISVTERQRYLLRIRQLTTQIAKQHYDAREALGFPLLREEKA